MDRHSWQWVLSQRIRNQEGDQRKRDGAATKKEKKWDAQVVADLITCTVEISKVYGGNINSQFIMPKVKL
jgi:hypothetical protein